MPKFKEKNAVRNSKPQVNRKLGKGAEKASGKGTKPKAAKKAAPAVQPSGGDSKQAKVLALLQRDEGATVDEMAQATGWQRHSVQGMMSGVLKKRLGLTIDSEKEERGRVYRLTGGVSRS